jgi:alcohol dehydrogenase class IV
MTALEQAQILGNKVLARGMKVAVGLLPLRDPELFVGSDAVDALAEVIAGNSLTRVLLVTGSGLVKRGQTEGLVAALKRNGVETVIYAGVVPDPGFAVVSAGLDLLHQQGCDSVVALGGGSAMDAAKVIAVAAANNCAPQRLVGYFKGRRKPLPLFAVPTTAGTGSEVTIASVISDDVTHAKAFVIDSRTVPLAAALEPRLMRSVPPGLTAAAGMDAFTHALEAYLSTIATPQTDTDAIDAIHLILDNLPRAYRQGSDLQARECMSVAAYRAGRAFTRASVGYVHAISHQLGAFYGTPHGLGNAIVLPFVLEFYQPLIDARLARLAVELGWGSFGEDQASLAGKVMKHIVALNAKLQIPRTVPELQQQDIPAIARGALREALLNYPVPRHMSARDCERLLQSLLPT